jgi:hypothetical protein
LAGVRGAWGGLRVGSVGQETFELGACPVVAASYCARSPTEDGGDFGLGEAFPVHETNDLSVERVKSLEGSSDVEGCL